MAKPKKEEAGKTENTKDRPVEEILAGSTEDEFENRRQTILLDGMQVLLDLLKDTAQPPNFRLKAGIVLDSISDNIARQEVAKRMAETSESLVRSHNRRHRNEHLRDQLESLGDEE